MSDPYAQFPSAPPPMQGYPGPAERGPRPNTVNAAFGLMMARVALSIVSLVVTFADKDEIKRKILDKTPNASQSTLNTAIDVAVVIGVIGIVLYVALAFVVRAGKNWGRIVTWVFAGLGILGALVALGQPTVAISRGISLVSALVDVVLVILLALRPSNDYFRSRPAGY